MEYRVYLTSLKKDETQSMTIVETTGKHHAKYSKSQKCKRVNHFIVKKCLRGPWKGKPTYIRLIKANRMLQKKIGDFITKYSNLKQMSLLKHMKKALNPSLIWAT